MRNYGLFQEKHCHCIQEFIEAGGWGWGRDHPDATTVERQYGRGVEKQSFSMKPTWTPIHVLPPTKHVTLGNYLSSLGLSFQMCKIG